MNRHPDRIISHNRSGLPASVSQSGCGKPVFSQLALSIALLCSGMQQLAAQNSGIQADPHAAGQQRPVIDNSANGLPLIQIATPNGNGLSHNQYQQFDVGQNGAILNNATRNANTQLGGWVGANPHLPDSSARIILNEVTSARPSHLHGYLEVAGQRAEVIVANPNGIHCNGCGFINTSRGVLTTGMPVFGGSGSLEAFRVSDGQIAIGANGFNDTASSQLDLIARSVQINGELHANALNVLSGANQINYAGLGVQLIQGQGPAPAVAIDVAALGGMYANKINLIGTEAGVGVSSYGQMAAAGDFSLDAAGHISLNGAASAGGKLSMASGADISNRASLSAGGDLDIRAAGSVDNSGQHILAGANLRLDSKALANRGGKLQANGNARLVLADDYTHAQGDHISAGGDLTIASQGKLINQADLQAGGQLALQAANIDNRQHGLLNGGGQVLLQATDTLSNSGRIYGEDIAIGANTLRNEHAATIADGTPAGVIAARQQLDIDAHTIINREHGLLKSGDDMHIGGNLDGPLQTSGNAASVINSSATIDSGGNLQIASDDLLNTNAHFASEIQIDHSKTRSWTEYELKGSSHVYSDQEAAIRNEDDIDKLVLHSDGSRHNDYTKRHITETTRRTVVTQTDPGQILAHGDMQLQGGKVRNDKSAIVAGGALIGAIEGLSNGGSNPQGELIVHRDVISIYHTTDKCAGGTKRCNSEEKNFIPYDLPTQHFDLGIWRAATYTPPISHSNPAQGQFPQIDWMPDNALFHAVTTPGTRYLIATDPAFTNYRHFLSSDYQLSRLSLDPQAIQKRLGDGYYEQKLINDQILQLTGRKTLGAYASNEAQYQALMDAGVSYAQQFGLLPGMALSAAQMAALTSDLVWLVEQSVTMADGRTEQVLAPVLYLSRVHAEDVKPGGALLAAQKIDLLLQDSLDNAGTIKAASDLHINAGTDIVNQLGTLNSEAMQLQATRDIRNQSGNINGQRVAILAGRDIDIATLANTSRSDAGTQIALDRNGQISAGKLDMTARRDITLSAAVIRTSGDTRMAADHDLNLGAVTTQEELRVDYEAQLPKGVGFSKASPKNHLYKRQETVNGSVIRSAGNIELTAGQDLTSAAAYVNSNKKINVLAGDDIQLGSADQQESYDQEVYTSSSGVLSSHTVHSRDQQESTQAIGSVISGDSVEIRADQDIKVAGSNVVSNAGTTINAGKDINIIASENRYSQFYDKTETTSGMFSGGSLGVTFGTRSLENQQTSKQLSHTASTIGSTDGDVSIRAGNAYTQTGSDALAIQGDIGIAAQRITINAATDTADSTQDTRFQQSGVTVQLTSPVIAAIETVQQLKKAASQTKDKRMQGLAAGAAALTVANTAVQVSNSAAPGGGMDIAISVGASQSKSHSEQHSSMAAGSSVAAGGNVSIRASGDGSKSDLTIQGSDVSAGNNLTLAADNQVNLLAAQNTSEQHSSNSSSSASIGISYGSNGLRVNASASGSRGHGDGDDLGYNNSHVTAGNRLSLASGGDTTLQGASASGKQITAEIGGDLHISSQQDRSHYASKQQSLGGNISFGTGVSGSISASRSKVNGDYLSVQEQSGIKAGDEGFQIDVGGSTTLVGGQIASTGQALQDGKNRFSSASLTASDLQNQSEYHAESQSISAGAGQGNDGKFGASGTGIGFGNASGSDSSSTRSGITGIAGDTTIRSDQDHSGALAKNWDGQQLQQDVEAQTRITEAFGKQAALAIGTYATSKLDELNRQIASETDPQKQAQLQSEADKWKEGGTSRMILHTAAGALTGGIAGAAGAATAAVVMPELAKQIDAMDLPPGLKQGLAQVAAGALGAVTGGAAGIAASVNTEANNRQLHQSERDWAKENAKRYQQFLADKTGESISGEEAYQRLLSAGYAIVDEMAAKGGRSDETAKQFIGLNKPKDLFTASDAERAKPFLNGNPDNSWTPEQQARFGVRNPGQWADERLANAQKLAGQPCDGAYGCDIKVSNILSAIEALEMKKILYQDDPAQRQSIEEEQRTLLNGMTAGDIELSKLAQADRSTLLEAISVAAAPALVGDLAKAFAKLIGAKETAKATAKKVESNLEETGRIIKDTRRTNVENKIHNVLNDIAKKIHPGQQGKHIPGDNNFIPGRSAVINSVNPQELLDGVHSGQYRVVSIGSRGQPIVDFGRPIGFDASTGLPTPYGTIHSGKNGAHIVPTNPTIIGDPK